MFKKAFFQSFSNRVIFLVSLSMVVVITLVSYIAFNISTRTINETVIQNVQELLALHNRDLVHYISELSNYSLVVRKDESLLRALRQSDPPGHDDTVNIRKLLNIFHGRTDIYAFTVYLPRQGRVYEMSRSHPGIRIRNQAGIEDEQWFILASSRENAFIHFTPGNMHDESGRRLFTLYRAIINIADQQVIAIVKLSVTPDNISAIFANGNHYVGVFNQNGTVFYVSDTEVMTEQMTGALVERIQSGGDASPFPMEMGGESKLVFFESAAEWTSMLIIRTSEINGAIEQAQTISIYIGLSAIAVSILLVVFLTKSQTRSLAKLVNQVSEIGNHSLNIRVNEKGNLETAKLAKGINAMLDRIHVLVEQNYVSSINEKEAKLKSLEAQINPHFLYNTLQAISSKALLADNKDVSHMINALSRNLRYLINTDVCVTVEEELSHLRHYFMLQKARFEERLIISMDVEDHTRRQYIPKLAIQTLAENAIKHGLEETIGTIHIDICVKVVGKDLHIQVSDDGRGITPERLAMIRTVTPGPHIGLQNLVERLRLLYNGNALLEIESEAGKGTVVVIKLPYEDPPCIKH